MQQPLAEDDERWQALHVDVDLEHAQLAGVAAREGLQAGLQRAAGRTGGLLARVRSGSA